MPEGVVIKLSSGARFKAASKHGLPFVAFTRSESFARTAFHNLPAWDEFAKGAESEMLRKRLDFTHALEELHAKSVKQVFRTGKAEEDAFTQWRLHQGKRRSKSPPKTRCTCPGCERDFPA